MFPFKSQSPSPAGLAGLLLTALALPAFSLETPAIDNAVYYIPAHHWERTNSVQTWGPLLPGWRYFKRMALKNATPHARHREPVEVDVDFHSQQITALTHEVRVVRLVGDTGPIEEISSQIHLLAREDDRLRCRLFFLADVDPQATATYLILYGNPDAPAPAYNTDLVTTGEDYALEIENEHYRAVLAKTNGHWKSLYPKHGTATFVGAGPPMHGGHGVEGTIHWGPDWSDERVGRYRLTSWDGPSMFDWDVIRGPVCVRLRRWGHPILSLGPQVGRPQKVMATVTYTFWSGQPYVIMESKLEVLEDVGFRDCRNDEFVVGGDLPEAAWMGSDGKIGFGLRGWSRQDPRWLTYFNRATGEGFGSIHLKFENTNPNWPQPQTVAFAKTGIWVRYPVRHAAMRAGEYVYEKNAYTLHRFEADGPESGFADLVGHQRRLLQPLTQAESPPAAKPITLQNVMDALRATNEFELYVEGSPWGARQLSFVDIGLVRNVAVDGYDIHIDIVMPYPGRETWFGWFCDSMEEQLRSRLKEVGQVKVNLVHQPQWTPQQMNDRARRIIGPTDE